MSGAASAQIRDRAVPDPASGPRLSNASISGLVELVVEGRRMPVRHARMTLRARPSGEEIIRYTSDDGGYRFERLSSGTYTLRTDKSGFVPAAVDAARFLLERPIDLNPDQSLTANFLMDRGGAIEGRFVDREGKPIAKSIVTATRVTVRAGAPPEELEDEGMASTDDLGRFRVHTLLPGSYVIHAVPPPSIASGYRVYFPGVDDLAAAQPIAVKLGETAGPVDVFVTSGPAMPGRPGGIVDTTPRPASTGSARVRGVVVRSDNGQPVPFATVAQLAATLGRGTAIRADELGRFDAGDLIPGPYTFVAAGSGFFGMELSAPNAVNVRLQDGQRAEITLKLVQPASIEGRIVDEFGDPVPGMDVTLLERSFLLGRWRLELRGDSSNRTGLTDDRGRFRFYGVPPGDYWVEAIGAPFKRNIGNVTASGGDVVTSGGFPPTYFPGTDRQASAKPIVIAEGDQITDLVIPLRGIATGGMSGRVTDASMNPVDRASVRVVPRDGDDIDTVAAINVFTKADGSFEIDGLPAAEYALIVAGSSLGSVQHGTGNVVVTPGAGRVNVPIVLRAPRVARGRVVFDGEERPKDKVVVRVWPMYASDAPFGVSMSSSPDAAYRFEVMGSTGAAVFRAQPIPGWALKSVTLNGDDVTNRGVDLQAADIAGLELAFTNRVGAVAGTVADEQCRTQACAVVLFADDARLWTLPDRNVIPTRLDFDGQFKIADLLPGNYLLIAVPAFKYRGEPDPAWLASHRGLATPIIITERQNTTVSLTLRR